MHQENMSANFNNLTRNDVKRRRHLGEHLTSEGIFIQYILPEIIAYRDEYLWADLFCGEGSLILPILGTIPERERESFFRNHIFMCDIQEEMVKRAVKRAVSYGIPEELACERIRINDSLRHFPAELTSVRTKVYHVTNPPYLYLGYIRKNSELSHYSDLFQGTGNGLQDLYQIAMSNDVRNDIRRMVYLVPTNFLFGKSVSERIRSYVLGNYSIEQATIIERKVFANTGTNILILFLRKAETPVEKIEFRALKISEKSRVGRYILRKEYRFSAGDAFDRYVEKNRQRNSPEVYFYLTRNEILSNPGPNPVRIIDSKSYNSEGYSLFHLSVSKKMYERLKENPLFVRTLDTGTSRGRAGLYEIEKVFGADGIMVEGSTYRTNPIHIFFNNISSRPLALKIMNEFNRRLEELREETDSEFMTTYKYSTSSYTRKYLGLNQVKSLMKTIDIGGL